jgi:hypothetical protein
MFPGMDQGDVADVARAIRKLSQEM